MQDLLTLFDDHKKVLQTAAAKRSAGQDQRVAEVQRNADKIIAEWNVSKDELFARRGQALDLADAVMNTADEESEYDGAMFAYKALDRALEYLPMPAQFAPLLVGSDSFRGDPFEPVAHESDSQIQSRALRSVELWRADDDLKESATGMIERLTDGDRHGVAEHVLIYGSPTYARAFSKWTAAPETFVAELDSDEARAWQHAQHHQRATLQLSGAVLPSPLDSTIVLTNDGDIDPMRDLARVDTTDSKDKRYITSAGSSFSFDAELAEVSDDTPTESEVTIEVHKAQGWIQASIEAAVDQDGFPREIAKIIADGKSRLEAAAFVTGTGTNQPTGISPELLGGSSEVSPATAEVFAAADVYAVIEALPPRFRARAQLMAELSTINAVDQFETASGAKLFDGLNSSSPRLLRRRLAENSSADAHSAIDVGATADNLILYVGDWENYVILDRVGMSVTYIPPGHLKGASGRPDGRVGWYAYWRVGGESLVDEAFRVLNVATMA